MARNSICIACERGEHKSHRRVIQPAPEGGVGGVVCTCKGECKDGRYKRSLDLLLGVPEGTMARVWRKNKR